MARRNHILRVAGALTVLALTAIVVYIKRPSPSPHEAEVIALVRRLTAQQEQQDARARAAIEDGRYIAIVREIQAGRIAADAEGMATLPPAYGQTGDQGAVYIERKPDGRLLVLFQTWRGKGDNFAGYLYASQPLVPADFQEIDWGQGGVHKQMSIGRFDYIEAKPLQGPWYQVSRSAD